MRSPDFEYYQRKLEIKYGSRSNAANIDFRLLAILLEYTDNINKDIGVVYNQNYVRIDLLRPIGANDQRLFDFYLQNATPRLYLNRGVDHKTFVPYLGVGAYAQFGQGQYTYIDLDPNLVNYDANFEPFLKEKIIEIYQMYSI